MDRRTSSAARVLTPTPPLTRVAGEDLHCRSRPPAGNWISGSTSTRRAAALPDPPYAGLTLRHLLSDTSGIPSTITTTSNVSSARRDRTTESCSACSRRRAAAGVEARNHLLLWQLRLRFGGARGSRGSERPTSSCYVRGFFRRSHHLRHCFGRAGPSDFSGVRTIGYRRANGTRAKRLSTSKRSMRIQCCISARDLDRGTCRLLFVRLLGARAPSVAPHAKIGADLSGLRRSWNRETMATAFWYEGDLEGFHSEVFPPSSASVDRSSTCRTTP